MYNKVIMIGRLTATPELHKTANDKSVARATRAKMGSVKRILSTLSSGGVWLRPWQAMLARGV